MAPPDDRFRILRWNTVLWLLFGTAPYTVAGLHDQDALRHWATWTPIALGAAHLAALRFPRHRTAFLAVLVAGLGAVAYLRSGGASLFVVSLPTFWLFTPTVARAVAVSGAGAAATLAGGAVRTGDPLAGNQVVTAAAFAAGAVLGAFVHLLLRRAAERSRRLAEELAAARLELADAHRREGAAQERDRFAREIHDTLAQGLASIVVLAEAARADLTGNPATSARLTSIERTARENLAEARVLVGAARRDASGSVARTLRRTLDRFAEDTGLAVDAELADVDCDQATRIALLRCTQESLANVRKHAAASVVSVVLAGGADAVELEVTDDGRGFDVAAARGFGLAGMRRRLAELGGEVTVTSSPGDGTRVLAVLPAGSPAAVPSAAVPSAEE
ncbi:sensor histidine kinase [Actinomadura algeriensis]|uniref:Oxygen sensor histidine kinase NreB n=1 Tax=Actinomadura algeriensis TaxID=1679523 RepID=A0ABR9JKY4_9ACTN|nr:sensor histidine kinase [Actinomadura algeriensis]MBE1531218.1 signal transduction histidine kinase [Actinomadura algeriensis]